MASTEIDTGLNPQQPITWFTDRKGVAYGVNGINRGIRWDGFASSVGQLGVTAPSTAPTITPDTGGAASAGDYDCAYRYVARDLEGDVYSNFSAVATVTMTANQEFNWSAMDAPTEARVTHVQLWRTTVGQTNVYYFVEEIAKASLGSHVDQNSDATLIANDDDEIMKLRRHNGEVVANRFVLPPQNRPYGVMFQDRAWYFGSVRLKAVTTTDGDTTVVMVGDYVPATADIAGWHMAIDGEPITYTVVSVSGGPGSSTITLDTACTTSATTVGTLYPPLATHRKLMYSEADEVESVPAANEVTLQDNIGDDQHITGGVPWGATLYVFCERSKYAVSFVRQPAVDASVRLIDKRGAFNNKCIATFEDSIYAMDDQGCYSYNIRGGGSGSTRSVSLSGPIQDQWRDGVIDFSASDNFFVEVDRSAEQVRFWVQMGDGVSDRCFTWNVRRETWDHERYEAPADNGFRGSCQTKLTASGLSQKPRSLIAGSFGRIFCREGNTDVMSQIETATCEASSGTGCTLTDCSAWAGWSTRSYIGATILFEETGQTAVIKTATVSTNKLIITYAETISPVPAATATVQVGVIPWSWTSRRLPVFTPDDTPGGDAQNKRAVQVLYTPFSGAHDTLNLRFFENYSSTPMMFTRGANFTSGIQVSELTLDNHATESLYSDTIHIDLDVDRFSSDVEANGFLELVLSGKFVGGGESLRFVTVEMYGFQGDDKIILHELNFVGFSK